MENMLLETTNDMSISEIIMDSQMILANSQQDTNKVLQRLCDAIKKQDETVNGIVEEQINQKTIIDKLEKNTNVICSPFHSKRKRKFTKLCKTRVWNLFNNNKDTSEYILFSYFLFKKIYGDVASHFDLDTWHDISMEDYENETSMYSQAKEFVTYWTPSDWYIKECIKNMIEQRDNGFLKPERCRALTEYLKITNNGEINPFC